MEIYSLEQEAHDYMRAEIGVLTRCADRMALSGSSPHEAVLLLLTAATVSAIRQAPPGVSIAPDLKNLMQEAMLIARDITSPPPRQTEFQDDDRSSGETDSEILR